MRLSEMRQLLESENIRLTKSLGQNFLHDGNQLRRIAAAAELSPADPVLEIGPGLGPLTELLLEGTGHVLAIEKDARLVGILRRRFAGRTNLELVHADALEFLRRENRDWSSWKLVSNLPYSVASPILVELALHPRPPVRMVATLQLEVAHRLAAGPGSRDYGLLTLLVQARYEPAGLFKIPAGCFFPAPDVDSACITLRRRQPGIVPDDEFARFCEVVRKSFGQRRKMMFKLLKDHWPEPALHQAFAAAGVAETARAEAVSLAQFALMARHLPLRR